MTSLLGALYSQKAELQKKLGNPNCMFESFYEGQLKTLDQVIEQVEEIVKALGFKKAGLDVSVPGAFRAYYEGGVNEALDLLGKVGEQKT